MAAKSRFGYAISAASNRCKNPHQQKYLPDHKFFDERLQFTHDLNGVKGKDLIFVAVPELSVSWNLAKNCAIYRHSSHHGLSTKGMEKDTFALIMSDVIADELPNVAFGDGGPNLSLSWIYTRLPPWLPANLQRYGLRYKQRCTVRFLFASDDLMAWARRAQKYLCHRHGHGGCLWHREKHKAMILTRALAEMSRFGVQAGLIRWPFGVVGRGWFITTCSSTLSRNYQDW